MVNGTVTSFMPTQSFSQILAFTMSTLLCQKTLLWLVQEKKSEINNKNQTKTYQFSANDVHDFAWTASPHYKYLEEKYKGIKIMAYMQPEHFDKADRYFESAKYAIEYMEKNIGKYPHSTLSLIDQLYQVLARVVWNTRHLSRVEVTGE